MNKILFLSGPTATGKTGLAIDLACEMIKKKNITCEIVNFDSMLFYKELSIGTARPSIHEQKGIPHHLVGIVSIRHSFNAFEFSRLAKEVIEKIFTEGKTPLLVGGSGFYLRALVKGMITSSPIPVTIKQSIYDQYVSQGIETFCEYLEKHDPESLKELHTNDHYRIIRAVEYHRTTGKKISQEKMMIDKENPYDFSINQHPDWVPLHLHIDIPKDKHLEIISQRVEQMLEAGMIEEVEQLLGDRTNLDVPGPSSCRLQGGCLLSHRNVTQRGTQGTNDYFHKTIGQSTTHFFQKNHTQNSIPRLI